MGDVLKFRAVESERYQELLAKAAQKLDAAAEELIEIGLNAAMNGRWRKWSDAQPVGTVLRGGFDLVGKCGDARLVQLRAVCDLMRDAASALRRR